MFLIVSNQIHLILFSTFLLLMKKGTLLCSNVGMILCKLLPPFNLVFFDLLSSKESYGGFESMVNISSDANEFKSSIKGGLSR